MAGTAVRRRLTWLTATVAQVAQETGQVRTLTLAVPGWPGHRAGQHLEVRLTAQDGYQAAREYSLASAPGEPVAITVERLEDGEVSPYLTQEARPGDQMEVRGPIGSYFTWQPGGTSPLMLVAGGSGIAPLRSILRHRRRCGAAVPARLVYSARTRADIIYAAELARPGDGVDVTITLTRERPPGRDGATPGISTLAGRDGATPGISTRAGRVDETMLREVAWPAAANPVAYVCGPAGFVENAATGLVALGYPPEQVRTERFGATG